MSLAPASGLHAPRNPPCASPFSGARARLAASPSTSGRQQAPQSVGRRRGYRIPTRARLFGAGDFDPSQLTYDFKGVSPAGPCPLEVPRWYTCTHNDFNGDVALTIGSEINTEQYRDWYRKLVRDEVIGQWLPGPNGEPVLYLTCHVSGDAKWLAPPVLRAYLFRKEMPLVLGAILHADGALFESLPELLNAQVYVCFESDVITLNRVVPWGILGTSATWPEDPGLSLETLLFGDDADSYRNGSTVAAVTEALLAVSSVFSPTDALQPNGSLRGSASAPPPPPVRPPVTLPPSMPAQEDDFEADLVRVRAEERSQS